MAAQEEERPKSNGLRASSILREFDSLLDELAGEAEKVTTGGSTSNESGDSGTLNEDEESENDKLDVEWNNLLRKGSLSETSPTDVVRPTESIRISDLFDFLPKDNDDDCLSVEPMIDDSPPPEMAPASNESVTNGEIITADLIENVHCSDLLRTDKSIPQDISQEGKTDTEVRDIASEKPLAELRDTRIISAINGAFDFLQGEENGHDDHAKKLSTVSETNEAEREVAKPENSEASQNDQKTVEASNHSTERKKQVRMREKSKSPARTLSRGLSIDRGEEDSEDDDDDDEVHVIPGAWRNSSFAYVGQDADTETESSANSTPRSSSPVTDSGHDRLDSNSSHARPPSMFPPTPNATMSKKKDMSSLTSSEDPSLNKCSNGSVLTPELRILSATDSERDFGNSFDGCDEDPLNRSEDSDAFEPIEKELMFKQKKDKKKWLHAKGHKKRSESISSVSTTASEREFRSKYRSLQKTRILRNASTSEPVMPSKKSVSAEVDHDVVMQRDEDTSGFGFHIWGNRPVIVSTVVEGGIAEKAGLTIGDVLVSVNDINIVDATTSQVVQIIGRGTRVIKLGISAENLVSEIPLCCGHLNKQGGNMLIKKWRKRWIELKPDHCLYYYKSEGDVDPLGAVPVLNYTVTKAPEINAEFAFKLTKYSSKTYYFVADSEAEMCRWANAINQVREQKNKANTWLDVSAHNVSLPALDIRSPDCHGYLYKMGNSNRTWRRRYCVLKDACLYYYVDRTSNTAKGVAHFHGYSVQGSMPYRKQHGFMLVPPEPEMRTFFFHAENETEQKRWIGAFQDSISNWVKVDG